MLATALVVALLIGTAGATTAARGGATARAGSGAPSTGIPAVCTVCDASRPSQRWHWLNRSLLITHDARGAVLCLSVGHAGGTVVGQPCFSGPGGKVKFTGLTQNSQVDPAV
jgi:hypothetical protein